MTDDVMTDAPIEGAQAGAEASEFVEWDGEVTGLGRRFRAASAPRWIVQTRVEGKCRKRVLGDADAISLADARIAAAKMLEAIRSRRPDETPDAPDPMARIVDFAERFLADRAAGWKPSTLVGHRNQVAREIAPGLGAMRVRDLTRADVQRWRAALPCSPATGNRALAVLSGMMRHAELLGIIPPGSNPCRGLRRRETSFKAHYLTAAEYRRLEAAISRFETERPDEAALVRFIALTGCRRTEARRLRWDQIEGDAARLPDGKTGSVSIWLGDPAKALLSRRAKAGPYVFSRGGEPMPHHRLTSFWARVRRAMKLERLRLHDLRHSFASVAVGAREGLRTVAGLLGHSELETTEGYAHLREEEIHAAAARVGDAMAKVLRQPVGRGGGRKPEADGAPPEIRRFMRSKSRGVDDYCATRGLDPDAFRAALLAWREGEAAADPLAAGRT